MPKPCPICVSPSRPAIERDILALRSPTEVARRWDLSRKTVSTHRNRDMDPLATMDLDADTRVTTGLRLQHVTSLNPESGGVRLGCEMVTPSNAGLRALQLYIDQTQKRRRLLAM